MSDLFELVRERPIDERPSAKPGCPWCGGAKLRVLSQRTTLLGGGDGTADGDPNHVHTDMRCAGCGKQFCRETKSGNTWYTAEDGRVLRGMPSCFERYLYRCAKCEDGQVERRYTKPDGSPAQSLGASLDTATGKWVRDYHTTYHCNQCGAQLDTETDYWYGRPHA